MANNFDVYKDCETCHGTGEICINNQDYDPGPSTTVPCSDCNGTGRKHWGKMVKEE